MQVGVGFPPSNLAPSTGSATLALNSNPPSINALTKTFFIEFLLGVPKLQAFKFLTSTLYPPQSIEVIENFRIWNNFSQNGNSGEDGTLLAVD
jgi:hypothetical protein